MAATNIEEAGNRVRNLVADSARDTTESLRRQLGRLQDELTHVKTAIGSHARHAAESADSYVHENPYRTAGLAALLAAVAVAVAMLASRR
jgi:ElaB/YqjD/DUF883 family membrane-anchored ribosome-binding protein